MSENNKPPTSQTELIIEKFIENLKSHPEFDEDTISRLREIATPKALSQYKKIEIAIKPQTGVGNENN